MTSVVGMLRAVLVDDDTVKTYVVSGAVQRIYPRNPPLNVTVPAISYTTPSNPRDDISNVTNPRVRYVCWSDNCDEADALADAVVNALNHYSGVSGSLEIVHTSAENTMDGVTDSAELSSKIVDVVVVVKGG